MSPPSMWGLLLLAAHNACRLWAVDTQVGTSPSGPVCCVDFRRRRVAVEISHGFDWSLSGSKSDQSPATEQRVGTDRCCSRPIGFGTSNRSSGVPVAVFRHDEVVSVGVPMRRRIRRRSNNVAHLVQVGSSHAIPLALTLMVRHLTGGTRLK